MKSTAGILGFAACCLLGWVGQSAVAAASESSEIEGRVQIRSLTVNGTLLSLDQGGRPQLPAAPESVTFGFGPVTNLAGSPLRVRYMLDGYDAGWRENAGEMRLSIRFFDRGGDQVEEVVFRAIGQTKGWTGTPETSAFKARRETVVVPARATGFWLALSSAGPPSTIGIYCVSNLVVSAWPDTNEPPRVLVPWAFDSAAPPADSEAVPRGWIRDGLRPSMAQMIDVGLDHRSRAFAIIDDDRNGHAEWHTLKEYSPAVVPGDRLLITWREAYSSGLLGSAAVSYPSLPAGHFRFRVNELTVAGFPTDAEASLAFEVPLVFWRTPWFWFSFLSGSVAAGAGVWRLLSWRRMRRQLERLEQQRALERERVRIAQDIHDDLGARVTQISLLSAVAQRKPSLSEEARADFGLVSQMTRDLVSALYETVWAVNPENDNLEALANYVCQLANQLCAPAQLRCRLEVPDLPPSFPVTSQVRHNLTMAVKEAIHNVVKHARASEVRLRIVFEGSQLTVLIQDDGCGFDVARAAQGHGLGNLRRRLDVIGGRLNIDSEPGRGTAVSLKLPLEEPI